VSCWAPRSAVFAVEEVAHGLTAGFVRLFGGLAFVGGHAAPGRGVGWFGGVRLLLGALGAAVGEAGFVWFQLELFFADGADFDGERHFGSRMILNHLRGSVL